MDASTILSLRLNNHQLLGSNLQTPRDVVSWMGAIQAQDYTMAKWGIGNRSGVITDNQVDDAINKGEIVRIHILRPTWHFVAKEDIHWMLQLTATRLMSPVRSYYKEFELTEKFIAQTTELIRKELEVGISLTRQEISDRLGLKGIVIEDRRLKYLMYHAELSGIVCSGVVRSNKLTYQLLEPNKEIFNKEESLAKLAYKFFRSHGPATMQDFIWWSGLTTSDARKAIESIRKDFILETVGSDLYILHESSSHAKDSNLIHFLPAFDEFMVSYKDRKELLHPQHNKKVIVSNGVFRPFVTKGGKIIGTWRKALNKNEVKIFTDFFELPNKSTQKLIDKVINGYSSFLK